MNTLLLQFICLVYLLLYAWKEHADFYVPMQAPWDYFWNVIVPGAAAGWIFVELIKN